MARTNVDAQTFLAAVVKGALAGKTASEIAATLDVEEGTVTSRYAKYRKQFPQLADKMPILKTGKTRGRKVDLVSQENFLTGLLADNGLMNPEPEEMVVNTEGV